MMKIHSSLKAIFGFCAIMALATTTAQADEWMVGYKKAMEKAKAEDKQVLINFTGSDWCGWCIKMDEETFSKPAFKKYADENLVLLMVDFPRDKEQSDKIKKQNEKLKQEYKVQGFPTFVLLDSDGKVLEKRPGYIPGGPKGLKEWLDKAES